MKNWKSIAALALIGAILASILAMSFSASATQEKVFILGDADGDGDISVIDATIIQKHLAQIETIEEENLDAADADHDYVLSVLDAVIIQKWLAKFYVAYPIHASVTMSFLDTLFPRPVDPTEPVTEYQTEEPTMEPTEAPPTIDPTEPETQAPTAAPTEPPTQPPTEAPTKPFTTMKGVDTSWANGDVNLNKVKAAGFDFVMIRCGYGDDLTYQDDSQFESTVKKAENIGMPWGTYLYSYALNLTEARSEVAHVKRLLKNKKPTLPVAFDMEDADNYKQRNGFPTNSMLINICKTFLSGVESAGYYPILYTNLDYMKNKLNDPTLLNNYDIWYAQWNSECEYPGRADRLGMWQYGGDVNFLESNSIPGVGTIDKNFMYKDYPTIIKNGGYNNWASSGYAESGYGDTQDGFYRIVSYSAIDDIDLEAESPTVSLGIDDEEVSCISGIPLNRINVHSPEYEPDYD